MNKKLWVAVLIIAGLALVSSGARAQLLDQATALTTGANLELGSLAHGPVSPDAIKNNLQMQGYSNISISPADPSKYSATAPGGMPVVLNVDAVTGKIISAVPQ